MGGPSRLLLVKAPYAQEIVKGSKVWELRSTNSHYRERIGIALAHTQTVIGEVNLIDVIQLDADSVKANFSKHRVPAEVLKDFVPSGRRVFAWVMANASEYAVAKPYQHPLGAIGWVDVGPETLATVS